MDKLIESLQNPKILIYLLIVISSQAIYLFGKYLWQINIRQRRKLFQLPSRVLINHAEKLFWRRIDALVQSGLLLATIIIVPFILVWIDSDPNKVCIDTSTTDCSIDNTGLAIAFFGLLAFVIFNVTDVAKAFLGGLAFKTVAAFTQPFQVGDRVTLKGISGKVVKFENFFVVLETLNDDQISIPTYTLWSEVLTSVNAGDRSSLCVMNFYLASFINAEQRQQAEDVIWDAIQASAYYEPSKPMQIYLTQTADAIHLTAKAYVASTYNEPLFTSDVTRAFLDFVSKENIVLAPSYWKRNFPSSY